MHVSITPPIARDEVAVGILLVYQCLMVAKIPGTHHVVQYHACLDDELHCLSSLLHGGEKDLPAKSHDAKCVLHNTSPTGYAVIGYLLLVGHIPA